MHDVSDPYVPITESYRLADTITDPDKKVYAEFVLFDHVRPRRALDKVALIGEGFRLIRYIGRMFAMLMPSG